MLAIAMAVLLQGPPPAPPSLPSGARPSVITNPDWMRRPTGEDMARFYPDKAQRDEIEGRATIYCTVTAEGSLSGCSVVDETPADYGFGAAALNLGLLFKMRPMTKDGVPVSGGWVRIPIRFMLPKAAPEPIPTLAVASRCYGFAAAWLERDPTSPEARLGFIGWRMMTEIKMATQTLRPSEFEARMVSLRQTGARELDDARLAADREACGRYIKGEAAALEKLLAEAADKP